MSDELMAIPSLHKLAKKYGTDKEPAQHNYTPMYERMLSTITVNRFLEIGLGNGASLKMWQEYYPKAEAYCIEYFDDENKTVWGSADGKDIPNLNLITGDSSKPETWEKVPYELDFIVDDGDHHPDTQIATFNLGFSHLKTGGLYFIEDLHCNFEEIYTGGHDIMYKWLFDLIMQQQTPGRNYGGNFYTAQSAIANQTARGIYSYHFYKSVIVFERA